MADLLTSLPPRSIWYGWGDPSQVHPLPRQGWAFLNKTIGATPLSEPLAPAAMTELRLADSQLPDPVREALTEVVGAEHLSETLEARAEHLGGKSYIDMYRAFHGIATAAPDAVIYPASTEQVQAALNICVESSVAVVPFGGGSSVVGGLDNESGTHRAIVVFDLRRMNHLLGADNVADLATFEAGMRGPEIEAALRPHGFTLGHYPQSHQQATIGGYVATRSAGQASTGYGRIDEKVHGVVMATAKGTWRLGERGPASAAGPNLIDMVVGSEGALGIICEATLAVHPIPTEKRYAAYSFKSFEAAAGAFRRMSQLLGHSIMPQVCRLSDEDETTIMLRMAGRAGHLIRKYATVGRRFPPCVAIFMWEDTDTSKINWRKRACAKVLKGYGGRQLPSVIAKKWEHGRFSGPYMRDELMRHKVFAETLETATSWERIPVLHDTVRQAILDALSDCGTPGLVQCHISHVYPSGASLYFTYCAREAADPIAQWQAVKDAAGQAIMRGGATITHHHAVGSVHRSYMNEEVGDIGVDLLRAVKNSLDPTDILNPGKLIP